MMSEYDDDLLKTARRLLARRAGQRGKLSGARVRRSISTSYYALFHFILHETGRRIVGSTNDLRTRRRSIARTISHAGMKSALDKIRGGMVDRSVEDFLRATNGTGNLAPPSFASKLANAFIDAQAKRHDADYDLNKPLSETDARLLHIRVKRVIAQWREAQSSSDRDFKHAICLLILLKGHLRADR